MSRIDQSSNSKHPCEATMRLSVVIGKTIKKPSIEDVLTNQGFYVGIPTGNSMWPMLRNKKDQFIIIPITEEIRIGDVVLFQQKEKMILHRVIYCNGNEYTLRGDNCISYELAPHEAIIGKLQGFYKGSTYYDCTQSTLYKLYCKTLKLHYLWNMVLQAVKNRLRRLRRKADE